MRSLAFVIGAVSLAILLYFTVFRSARHLAWHGLENARIRVLAFDESDGGAKARVTIESGTLRIGRRGLPEGEAEAALKARLEAVRLMYSDYTSPYSGVVSSTIECRPEDLPKPLALGIGGLTFLANTRLVPSGCSHEGRDLRAYVLGLYCGEELYLIEFYEPASLPESGRHLGFKCGS